MCLPTLKPEPQPLFDEDGNVNEPEIPTDVYIPQNMHQHVDSIIYNFDLEDGILAFVYGNEGIVVWTSDEAEFFYRIYLCLEDSDLDSE